MSPIVPYIGGGTSPKQPSSCSHPWWTRWSYHRSQKYNYSCIPMWVPTVEVKIRTASSKIAKIVYRHHREQSCGINTCLSHLIILLGQRCAKLIPNGVSRGDTNNAAIGNAYLAYLVFRGLDDLLIHVLPKKRRSAYTIPCCSKHPTRTS
jgi:hypothetical protein